MTKKPKRPSVGETGKHIWRPVQYILDHPDNGKGNGGAKTSTVFVYLGCGHVRSVPKSKAPSGTHKVRCVQCEKGVK